MTDRSMVTAIRVNRACAALDDLNEWLFTYPEEKLTDEQQHSIQMWVRRIMMKQGENETV